MEKDASSEEIFLFHFVCNRLQVSKHKCFSSVILQQLRLTVI